jgi:DNA-binding PadR family transcriptional regulator
VRIRELCELHEEITVGEILQDMNRAVEVDRGAILGTLLDLEKAGFIMVLEAEDPLDREVALV